MPAQPLGDSHKHRVYVYAFRVYERVYECFCLVLKKHPSHNNGQQGIEVVMLHVDGMQFRPAGYE